MENVSLFPDPKNDLPQAFWYPRRILLVDAENKLRESTGVLPDTVQSFTGFSAETLSGASESPAVCCSRYAPRL